MGIIAVGSIAIDSIKTPVGEKKGILGGSLSYFAAASSFLTKTKLLGVVGKDFSSENLDFLSKRAIILGIKIDFEGKTFQWDGYYTDDFGDVVTTRTELNSFANYEPFIPPVYKKFKKDILFLANIDPTIQKRVLTEFSHLPLKVVDTMKLWIETKRKELEEVFLDVDGIIINESELTLLTGERNIFRGIEKLSNFNFKFVVLKRGANGAMLFYNDDVVSLPAFPIRNIVDPTGAGDSFAGGFLSYLNYEGIKNLSLDKLKRALSYAIVVSSFTVEDFGVEGVGRIKLRDIKERYKAYKRFCSF
ncbi:MAG: PfkB family carbohydrate kinase [Brevinematales bacterium]|nr:PfkB family carbohydrate kinase [Brevinematales bacterium]